MDKEVGFIPLENLIWGLLGIGEFFRIRIFLLGNVGKTLNNPGQFGLLRVT